MRNDFSPSSSAHYKRDLKIVIVTQNDYFLIPLALRRLFDLLAGRDSLRVMTLPRRRSRMRMVRETIEVFSPLEFLKYFNLYARRRALDALNRLFGIGPVSSVRGLAEASGLEYAHFSDVNSEDALTWLRTPVPDLVVSLSPPQKFSPDVLQIPRRGCINVHSSLLPEYRGMMPTFWAMAKGESRTGVTVHFMDQHLDSGEIISQREVRIFPDDTHYQVARRCKQTAAVLLADTIERFRKSSIESRHNPKGEGSYFSFPSEDDVKRAREAGFRWI